MRSEYRQVKFVPSGRNLGGRTQIEFHHKNHVLALINSRSAMDTLKPPRQHVDADKPIKNKEGTRRFLVDEVGETWKRVQAVKKGGTDSNEPKTYMLKYDLQRKNSVQKQVEETYHRNHVNSMMRNIISINARSQKKMEDILNKSKLVKIEQTIKEQNRSNKSQWDTRSSHPLEAEWRAMRPQSATTKKSHVSTRRTTLGGHSFTNLLSLDNSMEMSAVSKLTPSQHYYEDDTRAAQGAQDGFALDFYDVASSRKMKGPAMSKQQIEVEESPSQDENDNFEALIIDQYDHDSTVPRQNKPKELPPQQQTQQEQNTQAVSEMRLNNTYQLFDKRQKVYRSVAVPLIPEQEEAKQQRTLKRVLMQIIMDYKIFQRELIFQVGNCLIQRNPWLEELKVLNVCKEISRNLYGFNDE